MQNIIKSFFPVRRDDGIRSTTHPLIWNHLLNARLFWP